MFIGFLVAASVVGAIMTGTVVVRPDHPAVIVQPLGVLEPQAPYREPLHYAVSPYRR